jgi:hypothetical protein
MRASELKVQVSDARANAKNEAQRDCKGGFLRSRGAWLIVREAGKAEPIVADGELEFTGTRRQMETIERWLTKAKPGTTVWVEGGWNHAESLAGFSDGEYDPWVSEWSVQVDAPLKAVDPTQVLLEALQEIADGCRRRLRKGRDKGDASTLRVCEEAVAAATGGKA